MSPEGPWREEEGGAPRPRPPPPRCGLRDLSCLWFLCCQGPAHRDRGGPGLEQADCTRQGRGEEDHTAGVSSSRGFNLKPLLIQRYVTACFADGQLSHLFSEYSPATDYGIGPAPANEDRGASEADLTLIFKSWKQIWALSLPELINALKQSKKIFCMVPCLILYTHRYLQ